MRKHLYLLAQLLIAFLFAGCASKEIFYFSKNTGSFGPYQKVQKTTNLQDSVAVQSQPSEAGLSPDDSPVLTASATSPEPATLPKPKSVAFSSGLKEQKSAAQPNKYVLKNKNLLKFKNKKQLLKPETNKKVQASAMIGFILGLMAVITIFAGSLLAFAFGLVGAIFGIIGLSTIKKNSEKFRGRGFAWVGIGVGILIPLFIIGYILAFAGAFSS
ncbi:DUF4190 domain-containing protein [Adhaeribacter radiodurans]|uniref:DUF4190 domain-containing protein n=1 Tax=Adhaeribacter radiodurans TaxID=2745197 RepID=A0A7L7LBY8_9BACT|nr:DUF4190 domain-containing protein [Adhaeribacter radiodurans]QMU29899.1 DUF4190 domain-containing protein [Adhaeribacter radiodurans]